MIFIADIQRAVADTYGLTVEQIIAPDCAGGSRAREFARPRQVAMYLSRQLLSTGNNFANRASLSAIGKQFGGRDHSTILHGCKVIGALIAQDSEERRAVGEVCWKLIERQADAPQH